MAGWFANLKLDDLTAQVSNLGQTLSEGAAKVAHDLQDQVSTVSQSVSKLSLQGINDTVKNAEHDIFAQEEKIRNEDLGRGRDEVKIMPWETLQEDKAILSHDLMQRVLSLSLEESNFTTPPPPGPWSASTDDPGEVKGDKGESKGKEPNRPEGGGGVFVLDRHISVAMRMLGVDRNLAKMHARLISKMPEETFWRNYFSRVAAMRDESGLEPLTQPGAASNSTSTRGAPAGSTGGARGQAQAGARQSSGFDTGALRPSGDAQALADRAQALSGGSSDEHGSSSYDRVSHSDVRSMDGEVKVGGQKPSPGDTFASLQDKGAAAGSGSDLGDEGFSDLGDLDDLGDQGEGDDVDDGDLDAELEAEIAAELGET